MYFLIILIVDMERIKSEREHLLFHEQRLLGIDAERGVDANCFGQGLEDNLSRRFGLVLHDQIFLSLLSQS